MNFDNPLMLSPILGALLFVVAWGLGAEAATQADFFVAPQGNDRWSGKLPTTNRQGTDSPFVTLEQARDAIRHRRAAGKRRKPWTVMLRGGTYFLSRPLVLKPEDSGTLECPIIYTAYPGEKPVLSGGKKITGWKPGEGPLWTAEVPEAQAGRWAFRQLFVNGEPRHRPRLPREGLYALAGPATPDEWGDPLNRKSFRFHPGDLQRNWKNLKDVEVVVLQFRMEARLPIAAIDEATSTVTFTGGSWRPLTWSRGYYVENVYEALDEPGEWYLDRKTGILTYWPLPGEDLARAEVIATLSEQLVRLEGNGEAGRLVEHLSLRSLTFRYAYVPLPPGGHAYPQAEVPVPAAIYAEGARHCRFEDNEIAWVGQWGLELGRGCQDNRIVGNHIWGKVRWARTLQSTAWGFPRAR